MSTVNDALRAQLAFQAPANEAWPNSGATSTQTAATPVNGRVVRVPGTAPTNGTANSSMILKPLADVGQTPIWVINDSAVTIQVYPAVGETQNGVANAALAIAAGRAGVFVASLSAADWRSAVIA